MVLAGRALTDFDELSQVKFVEIKAMRRIVCVEPPWKANS